MEVLIAAMIFLRLNYRVNPPVCFDEPYLMGTFEHSTLALCEDNVEDQGLENETVVRHEMIHAAQSCNSGLIDASRDYYELLPDFPYLGYEPEVWDLEAEARVLTNEMASQEVVDLTIELCRKNRPW